MNQALKALLISFTCLGSACFVVSAIEMLIKRDTGRLDEEDYRVLSGRDDEMEKTDEN